MTSLIPYPRIDQRTLLKKLQTENTNNKSQIVDKTVAGDDDIFNPINDQFMRNTKDSKTANTQLLINSSFNSATPCKLRPSITSINTKTKIPYPLTQLWSQQKSNYFKRSLSLRLRGTKSNLPLIMEPTINETSTTPNAAVTKVECTKNTHDTTTVTGGRFSSRRKLALISHTETNSAAASPLNRSLSLRRNYKVSSTNSLKNDKTDSSTEKLCAVKSLKSLSLHDVPKSKDQGDGLDTASQTTTTATENSSTQTIITENVKDNSKMVSF